MKLHNIMDIITKQGIEKLLNTNITVEVLESVGSTNTLLKQRAKDGLPAPYLLVTSHQTEGRGRMGRSFFSPDNSGIYMSLLLKPDLSPEKVILVTTAAAVAVCRATEKLCGCNPQIKWVNDIFADNKKVCGILTEASFSPQGDKTDYVVLGVGINLYSPQNGFPDELSDIAGYILEHRQDGLKDKLIAEIINEFYNVWQTDFTEEYKNRCFVLGKKINIFSPAGTKEAQAHDIDKMCRLKVRYNDGREEYISSGEVSIRI